MTHPAVVQVVNKAAATFAPRASTASKNPAVPGSTLYKIFEIQGYASMLLGGVLSFNLLFPSNEPDLWRLMGMWSIWMFSKSLSHISSLVTKHPLLVFHGCTLALKDSTDLLYPLICSSVDPSLAQYSSYRNLSLT